MYVLCIQGRLVSDRLYNVVEIARASMGINCVTSTEQLSVITILPSLALCYIVYLPYIMSQVGFTAKLPEFPKLS